MRYDGADYLGPGASLESRTRCELFDKASEVEANQAAVRIAQQRLNVSTAELAEIRIRLQSAIDAARQLPPGRSLGRPALFPSTEDS